MNRVTSLPAPRLAAAEPVVLVFSHLRWDFVFQRPQHLMSRAARSNSVFFIEEPVHADTAPHYRMTVTPANVTVLTPVFPAHFDAAHEQRMLVQGLLNTLRDRQITQWFYTPMAMRFAADLHSDLTVYDCMDELSGFRFAPADLPEMERRLLARADLVFTGGASLFAAKSHLHRDVHCFPSSVDTAHFGKARSGLADPDDQAGLPRPRVGFFGVIDERMDLGLVAHAAHAMPDVQFVMLGPIAKLDPSQLPRAANLHWLGRKDYAQLPAYLANWQAAWMPFALNESTQFISPTKTPEFLAAGLQVTSTAVRDVVAGWGEVVRIADGDSIATALRAALEPPRNGWHRDVDARLSDMSWDRTWAAMSQRMDAKQRVTVAV